MEQKRMHWILALLLEKINKFFLLLLHDGKESANLFCLPLGHGKML